MATLTLTHVQTILTSLVAQYTTLAATPIHSYSINARSAHKHKLAELRQEIESWSQLEAELGGDGGGVALAEMVEPS